MLGQFFIYECKRENSRKGWEEQIKSAIAHGDIPESDLFEGLSNEWDKTEWTWPE